MALLSAVCSSVKLRERVLALPQLVSNLLASQRQGTNQKSHLFHRVITRATILKASEILNGPDLQTNISIVIALNRVTWLRRFLAPKFALIELRRFLPGLSLQFSTAGFLSSMSSFHASLPITKSKKRLHKVNRTEHF
jgi:hypothetical protein